MRVVCVFMVIKICTEVCNIAGRLGNATLMHFLTRHVTHTQECLIRSKMYGRFTRNFGRRNRPSNASKFSEVLSYS